MPVSRRIVQKPSSTQAPMIPTAGSARPKSASQVRVRPPRPTAESELVDEAVLGEQPGPHDARGDQWDDLREEEDGSGDRAERAGRHASDERRDEEAQHDGDAAEEDDELEGVDDDAHEVRVGEGLDVVVEADERGLADAVPAQGGVLHGQSEWQQDERGVDDEGRQDEEPARPANAADPAPCARSAGGSERRSRRAGQVPTRLCRSCDRAGTIGH